MFATQTLTRFLISALLAMSQLLTEIQPADNLTVGHLIQELVTASPPGQPNTMNGKQAFTGEAQTLP